MTPHLHSTQINSAASATHAMHSCGQAVAQANVLTAPLKQAFRRNHLVFNSGSCQMLSAMGETGYLIGIKSATAAWQQNQAQVAQIISANWALEISVSTLSILDGDACAE